ncbi:Interleukin-20 [Chelonia mydas]|uniref:Interleukin-20 n=1 Tax=Chelonia mydas TaxID=8469 RepID=M7B1B4_CHEMY|nr:Interleukin-20 [Chelonia mydas]
MQMDPRGMSMLELERSFPACVEQAKDAIRTISILSYPYSLHNFNVDRCCIIRHLLRFYVDKVFKHCETEDSHVNRKISSIANSFLSIKKKFRQCNEQNACNCGEEATEKYKQILTNYGQNEQNACNCGEEATEKYKQILTNYGQHEVSMCHCGEDVKHKYGQILSQYEKQAQDRMTDVVLLKRVALQGVPHDQKKCSCGEVSNSRFQLIREEYEKLFFNNYHRSHKQQQHQENWYQDLKDIIPIIASQEAGK